MMNFSFRDGGFEMIGVHQSPLTRIAKAWSFDANGFDIFGDASTSGRRATPQGCGISTSGAASRIVTERWAWGHCDLDDGRGDSRWEEDRVSVGVGV